MQSDWQADNMTDPVRQAVRQMEWKKESVVVQERTLHRLTKMGIDSWSDYTPVGTLEFVKEFAKKIRIELPFPIHATELLDLEGRSWKPDSIWNLQYPCFVKPYDELKKFTGFVAKSDKDFDLYPEVDWGNTKLFVTDVLDNIVSEWRCYVLKGKVFACVNYSGDPLTFPNPYIISRYLENFTTAPIAYSLDVAITETGQATRFIEVNDAYALGYYGGNVELYTKMLDLRWKEIIQNQ